MVSTSKNKLINFLVLQINWFVAIYGATKGLIWPCIVITLVFAWWQLNEKRRHPTDMRLLLWTIPIGLILDSTWQYTELVQYVSSPLAPLTPVWIMMLWVTFALTINHSLAWLKPKPKLAMLLGFIGSPLSYWGGSRLGGMIYLENIWLVSVALGSSWAIVVWFLIRQSSIPLKTSHANNTATS